MNPVVLVPVQAPAPLLDACLAALERSLPQGAPVLLADDASGDPRIGALARGWCERSRLDARYRRMDEPRGLARNLSVALAELPEADVALLRCDGEPTPGWLPALQRAAADARAATVAAWSGEDELAAFPGADSPVAIAEAAASLDWPQPPTLPAAAGPALLLRRAALRELGGLDADSYTGWGALDDFCRRAEAMGWRNLLGPGAYVASAGLAAHHTTFGDIERLQIRWPDFQERVARFILEDGLREPRERLRARLSEFSRRGPQGDLFG